MEWIFLDFETHYSKEYTLKKLTPIEYVLDPRFETIMVSIKRRGRDPIVLPRDKVQAFFDLLDPAKTILVSHNALFDAVIVRFIYNFEPKMWVDTLGISRACLAHRLRSLSLASVAEFLKLGAKGGAVKNMIGMRYEDVIQTGNWQSYADYCANDSVLCEGIFDALVGTGLFPASELVVLDMVLRMALNPMFVINGTELHQHIQDIQTEKANLLANCGVSDPKELMSNERFATLLRALGVDPPMKTSPTTGRDSYAFARSDQAFTDLEEHEDLRVQALVSARMGHKSTIEETRCQRLYNISQLRWPLPYVTSRGMGEYAALMPMPLRYAGAHTGRLSGDWKLNVQNFPSRSSINHLKRALTAPPGHTVMNTDSSQIEARIVAWLAMEVDLLNQFENKLDPYKIFAATVFGIDVSQVTKEQRFLGKTAILGLGFGLGWLKFKAQVRVKSLEAIRYSGSGSELILDDLESQRIVNTYRSTYSGVPKLWRALNDAIPVLAGAGGSFTIGPCTFVAGSILLPNGLSLHYHNLRYTDDGWVYEHGGRTKRLYGGALLENIVQALARIIVMDAALRIQRRTLPYGVRLNLQVHDALCYVVPDHLVAFMGDIMDEEMSRRPAWAPDLPLASELQKGPSYGECK